MSIPDHSLYDPTHCVACKVAFLEQRVKDLEAAKTWTPCAERMPNDGQLVVLLTPDLRILGYRFSGGEFYREGFSPYPLHRDSAMACSWVVLLEPTK